MDVVFFDLQSSRCFLWFESKCAFLKHGFARVRCDLFDFINMI